MCADWLRGKSHACKEAQGQLSLLISSLFHSFIHSLTHSLTQYCPSAHCVCSAPRHEQRLHQGLEVSASQGPTFSLCSLSLVTLVSSLAFCRVKASTSASH